MEKPFLQELSSAFKVKKVKPKLYADVNGILGEGHYGYENMKLEYGYY